MQNSYNKDEVTYAGFWVRLAAYLIDSVIVFVGLLVVRLILLGIMSAAKDTALGGNLLFQYNLKDIALYVMEALYFILFTYYTGTTIGKRLMNLKVVRADGEERLSLLNVIYRETVGRFLCSVICGIGYILAGIDGEKRGLHDILADTRVIYAKRVKIYKKVEQINLQPHSSQSVYEDGQNKVMPWDAPYETINTTESNNEEKVPEHQEEVERDS